MKKFLKWSAAILGGILLIGIIFGDSTPEESTSSPTAATTESLSPEEAATKFVQNLRDKTAEVQSFECKTRESTTGILVCVAVYSAWAELANEATDYELTEEQETAVQDFKDGLSKSQRRLFPQLRDAYGPAARKTLWEHDVEAKTFGAGFRTIQFVGGIFAANRNIKQFQEGTSPVLHQLRFKRAQYKWYEGEDEYTYYTIESHDDEDLVIWKEGARYVEVE